MNFRLEKSPSGRLHLKEKTSKLSFGFCWCTVYISSSLSITQGDPAQSLLAVFNRRKHADVLTKCKTKSMVTLHLLHPQRGATRNTSTLQWLKRIAQRNSLSQDQTNTSAGYNQSPSRSDLYCIADVLAKRPCREDRSPQGFILCCYDPAHGLPLQQKRTTC